MCVFVRVHAKVAFAGFVLFMNQLPFALPVSDSKQTQRQTGRRRRGLREGGWGWKEGSRSLGGTTRSQGRWRKRSPALEEGAAVPVGRVGVSSRRHHNCKTPFQEPLTHLVAQGKKE